MRARGRSTRTGSPGGLRPVCFDALLQLLFYCHRRDMLRYRVRKLLQSLGQVCFALRFRLLLLVLLACVPLVGLTLHTGSEARRREHANWNQRLLGIQQLADVEEERLLGHIRQVLLAISVSGPVRSGNERSCHRLLTEVFTNHPSYVNLAVLKTNGELLASARPFVNSLNQAERRFLRQTLETRGFAMGYYRTGVGASTALVQVAYPAMDPRGQIHAVVVATIDPDWCSRSLADLNAQVPSSTVLVEIDRRGTVLARYPPPAPETRAPSFDPALFQTVLRQGRGSLEARDSNGVLGWYAFSRRNSKLLTRDVTTILGIPKRALFAEANRVLKRNVVWLGGAVGVALLLGWVGSSFLIVRPVQALVRASSRLAAGDFSSRTGLRHGRHELGQLTRRFDQMAEALEQRERQRRLAEETLETRDHVIRELPLFPAAVCVCDQSGAVQLYNRAAVELWGCEPPDPDAGRYFCGSHRLYYPDGTPMPHDQSPMAEVLRTGGHVRSRELVIERPDGSRVPVLANVVALRDAEGALIGAVSCLQDVTERKRTEERLQESHDKLQLLSRRLVESQETERRHIARELHDEVGQALTVAEMNLQAMVQSSRVASVKARLQQSLQAVERVLEQVRDLSLNLRPSMLDDLGLEPALRWYATRQASVAGLSHEFRADAMDQRLDPLIETACFRVAQEALTNVARHARAHSVALELRQEDGRLHLSVRDDGVGFEVAALRERAVLGASLGLLSMEERAVLVGGGFECRSAPGQGAEVHAWFPLKWRTPDA